jgi:hypothetical protein
MRAFLEALAAVCPMPAPYQNLQRVRVTLGQLLKYDPPKEARLRVTDECTVEVHTADDPPVILPGEPFLQAE